MTEFFADNDGEMIYTDSDAPQNVPLQEINAYDVLCLINAGYDVTDATDDALEDALDEMLSDIVGKWARYNDLGRPTFLDFENTGDGYTAEYELSTNRIMGKPFYVYATFVINADGAYVGWTLVVAGGRDVIAGDSESLDVDSEL